MRGFWSWLGWLFLVVGLTHCGAIRIQLCPYQATQACRCPGSQTPGSQTCQIGQGWGPCICGGQAQTEPIAFGETTPEPAPTDAGAPLPELPPAPHWKGLQIGDKLDDDGFDIAADAKGNIYLVGSFQGNIKLGEGAGSKRLITSSKEGNTGTFVAKVDASGKVVWATQITGSAPNRAYAIAVTAEGESVITGKIEPGSATFGSIKLRNTSAQNMFVARLSKEGIFQWARTGGPKMRGWGTNLSIDSDGYTYLLGSFQGEASFDTHNIKTNADPSFYIGNLFLAKIDAKGTFQWASTILSQGEVIGAGIAVAPDRSIVVTGASVGAALVLGRLRIQNLKSSPIFVTKLNKSGLFLWAKVLAYTSGGKGTSLALSSKGDIYVAGRFRAEATFGKTLVKTTGGHWGFVARLNTTGEPLWVKTPIGDVVQDITLNDKGDLYAIGSFYQKTILGGQTLRGYGYDVFITTLSESGEISNPIQIGGDGAYNFGRNLCFDAYQRLFAIGSFSRTLKVGDLTLRSQGEKQDAFVLYFLP